MEQTFRIKILNMCQVSGTGRFWLNFKNPKIRKKIPKIFQRKIWLPNKQ